MKLDTNWVVMKVTSKASQYGGWVEEVTFANCDLEIAHTYLDQDNSNYKRWQDIIEAHDRGMGVVVSGLTAKKKALHKKTHEPLVNADSPVKVVHVEEDRNVLMREFVELLETV